MRLYFALTLLVTSLACGCVLDSGVPPSERVYPPSDLADGGDEETSSERDDALSDGQGGTGPEGVGPQGAPSARPGFWPTSYTTTLQGGGWTLTPLGAHQGLTGTLRAPDGSLQLEALP